MSDSVHVIKHIQLFKMQTTRPDRSWFINPGEIGAGQWWLAIAAIIPALLATILIYLDQQITAVIVNRKEHKLKV